MKPLTSEWVDKAEGDFITARRELRARKAPNYDAACFHAQQCAEKYLKARLQEEGIAFSRTHDLATLLDLLLPVEPSWAVMRSDLDRLTSFAVEFRYPGTSADKAMARSAVAVCQDVRHRVRMSLGLAP
jgi:HEPN domain-containing protein